MFVTSVLGHRVSCNRFMQNLNDRRAKKKNLTLLLYAKFGSLSRLSPALAQLEERQTVIGSIMNPLVESSECPWFDPEKPEVVFAALR